jgi:uncharacterized protein YggE
LKTLLIIAFLTLGFQSYSNTNPQLISVNGIAEQSIEPNMVILNLESFGAAATAKKAQELQAKEYLRIKSVIEKYKIAKNDFTTENFSIQPESVYDQKTRTNKVTGYRVSHLVKLTYKKTDEAGQLIDALASKANLDSAGLNIQSISWDSDKKLAAEALAMADAVKSAKIKAEVLAKAAGVKIKNTYLISQQGSVESAGGGMRMMKMVEMDSAATTINGGQIKVRSEVLMQFEIN